MEPVGQGGFGKLLVLLEERLLLDSSFKWRRPTTCSIGCINRSPAVINVQDPDPLNLLQDSKGKFVSEPMATRAGTRRYNCARKTLGSGSQFKVKGDNSVLRISVVQLLLEQQDPGITGETKTESKPDAGVKL